MSPPIVRRLDRRPTHLNQAVTSIVMVPQNRTFTLTARKAHANMLAMAQDQIRDGRAPQAGFSSPLKALMVASGSGESTRPYFLRYVEEMVSTTVEYRPIDATQQQVLLMGETGDAEAVDEEATARDETRLFTLLAEVRCYKKGGDHWVDWYYPPTIQEELLNPRMWSRVNLDVIRELPTYASVALYQICVRYQNNPGGVTMRRPVGWWDEALRHKPETKPRTWRRLKADVLVEAIRAINSIADIRIQLREYKQGREVVSAQFEVEKQERPKPSLPEPIDVTNLLRGAKLGLREHELEALEKEFGTRLVTIGLDRLEKHLSRHPGQVASIVHYLDKTIRNYRNDPKTWMGGQPAGKPMQDFLLAQASAQASAPAQAPARTQQDVEREVGDRKYALLEREFQKLSGDDQTSWTQRFRESLPANHILVTQVVSRTRLDEGQWSSPIVKRRVLAYYAEGTYGKDWYRDLPDSEIVSLSGS